jgi:hydroxymethylpyrimidine pyrophosphatase-like HAD family hydrolase
MDQAAAFGDNGNDASMLKAAGIGVAMGNSDETCRQAADYVTARIEEDGLYQACLHYGWIRP